MPHQQSRQLVAMGLSAISVPAPGGRVAVVAPHPDDETLGAGATTADLVTRGFDVEIIIVSDGAASHAHADLSAIRMIEASRAADALGVERPVRFLGLPDGDLVGCEGRLMRSLTSCLAGASLVIAPRIGDGHPDHEATAVAVTLAIDALPVDSRPVVWRYAIWAWQGAGLGVDDLESARRWNTSESARRRRALAAGAYVSQTTDLLGAVIVPPSMVEDVCSADEVFWC